MLNLIHLDLKQQTQIGIIILGEWVFNQSIDFHKEEVK